MLINAEASAEAVEELTTNFRYNDAVLRNLIIRCDEAVTEESPIMKAEKESRERRSRSEQRVERSRDDSESAADDDSDSDAELAEDNAE